MTTREILRTVIDSVSPLDSPLDGRMPLYVWAARLNGLEESETREVVQALADRGIGAFSTWQYGQFEKSCSDALLAGKVQKSLGLPVNVDATRSVYSFFNGASSTAHIDDNGKPFFDLSFGPRHKIGCPFAIKQRIGPMKARLVAFLKSYRESGIPVDLWTADWEIDGPIEWNDAWNHSKRCARCRKHIRDIDDFSSFQMALRRVRSELQQEAFVDPIKGYFPNARIGNYGVYAHNGFRYWYDYFEKFVPGCPHVKDHQAKYRQWVHEFEGCGYTLGMPVVYTWYPLFSFYPFEEKEYRWFYNMLLVGSNAGEHKDGKPLITFVHWNTTNPPKDGYPDGFVPLGRENYQELVWHLYLRGHDAVCLWTPINQLAEEVRAVHEVFRGTLQFNDFLKNGKPELFDVLQEPGPVVSAVRLGNKALIRRTDFGKPAQKVEVQIGGKHVTVPKNDGRCSIIDLSKIKA